MTKKRDGGDGTKRRAAKAAAKPAARAAAKGGRKAVAGPARGAAAAPRGKAKATPRADSGAKHLALAIADAGLEKKALNVEIIDVRDKVDYADYVIVMSGRSDRQVAAIARGIEEQLERELGQRCLGVEGLPQGTWVLMDFGDAIVHIFHEDTRGYYDLESLWIDAARVEVQQPSAS